MDGMYDRSILVFGEKNINILKNKTVVVFGLGGVGGYVVEMLARVGIGNIFIVDFDKIDKSNKNRQIIALDSTIGLDKISVMEKRIKDIDKTINVKSFNERLIPENVSVFFDEKADYVVDAIDNLTSKLALIEYCKINNISIISSMGTGNKIDPRYLKIADIYETDVDPMAKLMRKELKKRKVESLTVVFSNEKSMKDDLEYGKIDDKRKPGSLAFVPASAGIMIAYKVVSDILDLYN